MCSVRASKGTLKNVQVLLQYHHLQLSIPHHHEYCPDIPVSCLNTSSDPVDVYETVPSPIPRRLLVA